MAEDLRITKEKMDRILKLRSGGFSREECAKLVGVPLSKINHWYKEGQQGFGEYNINFYKHLSRIETKLENNDKYAKEIREFSFPENINKRKQYLHYIRQGETRKDSARHAKIDLKIVDKWDLLGRKEIKPFLSFHKEYKKARQDAVKAENRRKDKLKTKTVNLIKNGKTIREAAKIVDSGKHEQTIINWYNAGKRGDKNHSKFYQDCEKAKIKPTKSKNKPRKPKNKLNKPKNKPKPKKSNVKVDYVRRNKETFLVIVKGEVKNYEVTPIMNKLKIFTVDMEKARIKKIDEETKDIRIEFSLDVSLLNKFESIANKSGWKITK